MLSSFLWILQFCLKLNSKVFFKNYCYSQAESIFLFYEMNVLLEKTVPCLMGEAYPNVFFKTCLIKQR